MINKPTVLVLGAGASVPYGFPSAKELQRAIGLECPPYHYTSVLTGCGFAKADISFFRKQYLHSGRVLIDAFIERNSQYIEIGKAAIASVLNHHELTGSLFADMLREYKDSWYELLYERLVDDISSLENFAENKLSIITFNYDRSLEQYLFTALQNLYNKTIDQEVADVITKIPIVHVYGSLGALPWQDKENGIPYNPDLSPEQLKKAADNINILREEETPPAFADAHKLLQKAQNIYFLGFGFHERNIERLKIDELSKGTKNIRGTCMGLGQHDIYAFRGILSRIQSTSNPKNALIGTTNYDFLHQIGLP